MAIHVLLVLTAGLLVFGAGEYWLHRRCRDAVALRVHVNGTRGKSSVSRLIGAGLRHAGRRTIVKTTGSAARIILEDGCERPIARPGPPRIIEQIRMFRIAADRRAEAMVVECMALQPFLQFLSERQIVRAQIAVITNVRADHLDVMGPDVEDVATALAGVVPVGGTLVTRSSRFDAFFEKVCRESRARLILVRDQDVAAIDSALLGRLSYIEHAENVAVALAVCEVAGVDRATALAGMERVTPDPGAMRIVHGSAPGGQWTFADAFAANDPDSNIMLWRMLLERYGPVDRTILIVNCRPDRLDRSRQMGRMMSADVLADLYVLVGGETRLAARTAVEAGLDAGKILSLEGATATDVFQRVIDNVGARTLIVGMGNIKGMGEELAVLFRKGGHAHG